MNKYAARVRNENGFTLIELMVVIVILAVLGGIVLFAVGGIQDRGAAAACKTDVSTVTTAVEAYKAKHGNYPDDLTALTQSPDQFLRPQPTLGQFDLTQNGGAGNGNPDGYTSTYAGKTTGQVTVQRSDPADATKTIS